MTTEKNPIDYACATTDEPEGQFRLSEFYKEEASKLDYQTDNFHLDYHELTKQSFYWCVKAAQQGHLEALDTLGWYYESGFGVERDHSQAFTMYLEAAEAGHAKAQFHLAKMLALGRGADYDPDEAVRWAKKAAINNIKFAATLIACFYRDGVLNDEDNSENEAYYWYEKAAEEGAEWAVEMLGRKAAPYITPYDTYTLDKMSSLEK
jgi:TPR repeat protein